MKNLKRVLWSLLALIALSILAVIAIEAVQGREGADEAAVPHWGAQDGLLERGAYLARAGNCMGCHTLRGGVPYAGGRAIRTPFGDIYAPNLTPDRETGIGAWDADDFWRALHNGKSRDGSFLYPAFPYTNYTRISRVDSDALHAFFMSLAPAQQANREHELRFPYNQRWLLPVWRALYFRPGVYQEDATRGAEWNRGAYLVQGPGHCSACHANRNALGATRDGDLEGGLIPILDWYAPSLTSDREAGLGGWEPDQIVSLLRHGVSSRSNVYGPMAEVVRHSLQHLTEPDIRAMAGYLKSLPQHEAPSHPAPPRLAPQEAEALFKRGAGLYQDHCASCHRADGKGKPPAYPPLAGNRSVAAELPINPIRMVLNGGYPPSTGGNPRPFGMPPFGPVFSDEEAAAVVSYIRQAWGNKAAPVPPNEVRRYRAVPVD